MKSFFPSNLIKCFSGLLLGSFHFYTSPANAIDLSFAGKWSGSATIYQDGKKVSDCTKAILEFKQSQEVLETIQGLFECRPMIIKSKPKQVMIHDGFMYLNDLLVGVIGDRDIFSSYWDTKAGWNHQFRLRKMEEGLQYFEMVTLSNGFEYYRIEGLLKIQ